MLKAGSQLVFPSAYLHSAAVDTKARGQVLFTLDRRPFEAALEQAEASLARDLAQSENAKSSCAATANSTSAACPTPEQMEQINATATALEATIRADRATELKRGMTMGSLKVDAELPTKPGADRADGLPSSITPSITRPAPSRSRARSRTRIAASGPGSSSTSC